MNNKWIKKQSFHHKPVSAVTSKRGRSSLLGKNPSSRFGRIIPFRKTKNLNCRSLCMSLVFKLFTLPWNFSRKVLKIYRQVFFFNSKNLLSSIEQCTWLHLYFLFEKFHLKIHNKMADNKGTDLPHETGYDISKDCFCYIDIFIKWFEDYQYCFINSLGYYLK